MNVTCDLCGKEFNKKLADIKRTKHNFCSKSCATSYNNKKNPRKKKTNKCIICQTLILSDRQKCPRCIENWKPQDMMLSEAIYQEHHKSSAFALVRSRARAKAKEFNWTSCKNCGYNKHIEICHIKPISDFDNSTFISEINSKKNLIPLCRNCHWEFDKGLLTF